MVGDLGATTDGSGIDGDDPAREVADAIVEAGGRAVASSADVTTEEGAVSLVEAAISAFGRLDAVINNAGIVRTAPFDEVPYEEYQRHLDVHYFGALRVCRAAWPHLLKSPAGRVVNTISQAMLGNPGMSHYGGSKGALFGLTRNLAVEGLAAGVMVNAIAPGAGTRMAEASADSLSPEVMEYMRTHCFRSMSRRSRRISYTRVAPSPARCSTSPAASSIGSLWSTRQGFTTRRSPSKRWLPGSTRSWRSARRRPRRSSHPPVSRSRLEQIGPNPAQSQENTVSSSANVHGLHRQHSGHHLPVRTGRAERGRQALCGDRGGPTDDQDDDADRR